MCEVTLRLTLFGPDIPGVEQGRSDVCVIVAVDDWLQNDQVES